MGTVQKRNTCPGGRRCDGQERAPRLADTWFGDAIKDLDRATKVFLQVPEIWYNLGLAMAGRGPSSRAAANAFEQAARYAEAKDRLGLAAESVLLAAAELRSVEDADGARNLLHEYLPLLDRCAELYVSLAVHHGETGLLTPAFKIAPLLAVAVQAKIDELREQATVPEATIAAQQEAAASAARLTQAVHTAAAEACRAKDSPLARLRALESTIQTVIDTATKAGLDFSTEGFTPATLPPQPGVAALLLAEVRIQKTAERARAIGASVRHGLGKLDAPVSPYYVEEITAELVGAAGIREAEELKARAYRAHEAEKDDASRKAQRRYGYSAPKTARGNLAKAERDLTRARADLKGVKQDGTWASKMIWDRFREASACAKEMRASVQRLDDAQAKLKEAEAEYRRAVRLAREEVRKAEAVYKPVRAATARVAASISRALADLETAITVATTPRNRVVPRADG